MAYWLASWPWLHVGDGWLKAHGCGHMGLGCQSWHGCKALPVFPKQAHIVALAGELGAPVTFLTFEDGQRPDLFPGRIPLPVLRVDTKFVADEAAGPGGWAVDDFLQVVLLGDLMLQHGRVAVPPGP